MNNTLISVKVLLEDGTDYSTPVNAANSDKEIREYFIGKHFNMGQYPIEKMVKCIGVEIFRK